MIFELDIIGKVVFLDLSFWEELRILWFFVIFLDVILML